MCTPKNLYFYLRQVNKGSLVNLVVDFNDNLCALNYSITMVSLPRKFRTLLPHTKD
jgi:hypothetical protein